jgi:hypothetical protein
MQAWWREGACYFSPASHLSLVHCSIPTFTYTPLKSVPKTNAVGYVLLPRLIPSHTLQVVLSKLFAGQINV